MANTKISNLPDLNVVDSTATFPLSSNTTGTLTTYQASVGNIGIKVLTGNGYTLTNTNAANIIGTYSNITATGNIQYGGVLTSNVANGTAPMIVTSTTKVANLNVDLVDGRHVDESATANTIVLRDTNGNVFANYYVGNGSRLTGINGSNVTGTVANATYSVSAGSVANALTINNSGSGAASGATYDGSATKTISYNTVGAPSTSGTGATGTWAISITGNANVANTANSVSGSNIVGEVANANYSTYSGTASTANSVTAANVSGLGNVALLNKDGNASNILYGNGVFAAAPTSTYSNSNVASFLASYGSNTLTTTGNIAAGNLTSSGIISSTGNVTGGNITTGGAISATGNITGGNLSVSGNISGNFVAPGSNTQVIFNDAGLENATSGLTFVKTNNSLTATGNITGANLTTGGLITATGNITGGNLVTTGNVVGNVNGFAIGYRDIPPVDLTANATIQLSDAGKQYYSTSANSIVVTIANNASQAFNVGTAINIINQGVGNITIAQGTGVSLYLAGNNISGNRILSSYGMCTINKVATNIWFVVGVGLT